MNTTAAALIAVGLLGAALIVANALESPATTQPTLERDDEPTGSSEGNVRGGAPELGAASADQRFARLEAELREARAKIDALQGQAGDNATAADDDTAAQPAHAETQAHFFALRKARDAGTASKEQLAELLRLSKDKVFMGRVVASLEAKISEDPDDLEARMQLANVESARVHIAESITERAMFGKNVGTQIREVLQRDPENWDARFMQAVGISHSERTPQGREDAIRAFESLLELQSTQPSDPRFSQTYSQLAVVYLSEKDATKALETVTRGLASYPGDKDLQEMLKRLTREER